MRQHMQERIDAIERFTFDSTECRSNTILHYFGEQTKGDCGHCDVCRDRRKHVVSRQELEILQQSIIYLASKTGGITLEQLISEVSAHPRIAVEQIRKMMDQGILIMNEDHIIKR